MKRLAVVFLTAALVAPSPAQDQSKTAGQDQKGAVVTGEVLLDSSVKAQRRRAVTALAAADCEVCEDGMKQPVESFRLITRNWAREPDKANAAAPERASAPASATPAPSAKPASTSNSDVGVSVVALVFDRL